MKDVDFKVMNDQCDVDVMFSIKKSKMANLEKIALFNELKHELFTPMKSSKGSQSSAESSQSSRFAAGSLPGMVEILVARRNLEHLGLTADEMEAIRKEYVLVEDYVRDDSLSIIDGILEKAKAEKDVIKFELTNVHAKEEIKKYVFHPDLKQLCLKKEVHLCSTENQKSANKAKRIEKVLTGARDNMSSRRSVSLREVHYIYPEFYAKHAQKTSNDDVTDISTMTGLTMQSLNIFTSPTGTIRGPLLLFIGDKILADCETGGISGCRIPAEVHNVTKIKLRRKVEYILVAEKEDVFEELAADNFPERNNCVLFSGGGQPSVSSRLMLRMLRDTLEVPVYSVFDGNYGGALIYCTYRFGSANRAYDSLLLTIPDLVWLGVFPSDVKNEYRREMEDTELAKLESLAHKEYIAEFPIVRERLLQMCMLKKVCDMEMVRMDGTLSKYIEEKVKALAIPPLPFQIADEN